MTTASQAAIEAWKALNRVAGSLGMDPERYTALDALERRYYGHAYEGRQYAWGEDGPNKTVPRRSERRPSRQYNLARRAADEVTDFLCGAGRFPALLVEGDDPATEAIETLSKATRLEVRFREAALHAVIAGSAAVTVEPNIIPRPTHLQLRVWRGKHCIPTFGQSDPVAAAALGVGPDDLLMLRVLGAYPTPSANPLQTEPDWWLWRRDYTPTQIVEYAPIKVPRGIVTEIPRFTPARELEHGFGRVPAVWLRTGGEGEASADGPGLCEAVESILTGIDETLSGLDGSVQYNTNPLLVFTNLNGEAADRVSTLDLSEGNTLALPPGRGNGADSPDAKFVSHDGVAHASAREHVAELRRMALEVLRVIVRRDDENAGALSGTALQILYRPMLGLVEGYRQSLEPSILSLVALLLDAGQRFGASLTLPAPLPTYSPGPVSLDWPPVFAPTSEDLSQHGMALSTLVTAGLLSRETAIEKVCALLRVRDPQGEKARIESEAAAMLDAARAAMDAEGNGRTPSPGDGSGDDDTDTGAAG